MHFAVESSHFSPMSQTYFPELVKTPPNKIIFEGFSDIEESNERNNYEKSIFKSLENLKLGGFEVTVTVAGNERTLSAVVSPNYKRKLYLWSEVEKSFPRLNKLPPVAASLCSSKEKLLINFTYVGPARVTPTYILFGQWLTHCRKSVYLILYDPKTDVTTMTKCASDQSLDWVSHFNVPVENMTELVAKYTDFALVGKRELKNHLGHSMADDGKLISWVQREQTSSAVADAICHRDPNKFIRYDLSPLQMTYYDQSWAYGELILEFGTEVAIKGYLSCVKRFFSAGARANVLSGTWDDKIVQLVIDTWDQFAVILVSNPNDMAPVKGSQADEETLLRMHDKLSQCFASDVANSRVDRAAYLLKPNSSVSDPNAVPHTKEDPKRKVAALELDDESLPSPPAKKRKYKKAVITAQTPSTPGTLLSSSSNKRKLNVVEKEIDYNVGAKICKALDEHYNSPGHKKNSFKTMYHYLVESEKLDTSISLAEFNRIRYFFPAIHFCLLSLILFFSFSDQSCDQNITLETNLATIIPAALLELLLLELNLKAIIAASLRFLVLKVLVCLACQNRMLLH